MKIRDMMSTKLITCDPDETLSAVANKMQANDIGCCPVVERDRLIGMVTDRDIAVRAVARGMDPNSAVARDVMTIDLITGDPEMSDRDACEIMAENQIRRLPIVEGNRLIGMVSLADLAMDLEEEEMLADMMARISAPSH